MKNDEKKTVRHFPLVTFYRNSETNLFQDSDFSNLFNTITYFRFYSRMRYVDI